MSSARTVAQHAVVCHPPDGGKFPFWSPDGKSLYFASLDQHIWKVGLTGGPPTQITSYKSDMPQASPDGKFIYFQRASAGRIAVWRSSVDGGDEEKIIDSVHPERQMDRRKDGPLLLHATRREGSE